MQQRSKGIDLRRIQKRLNSAVQGAWQILILCISTIRRTENSIKQRGGSSGKGCFCFSWTFFRFEKVLGTQPFSLPPMRKIWTGVKRFNLTHFKFNQTIMQIPSNQSCNPVLDPFKSSVILKNFKNKNHRFKLVSGLLAFLAFETKALARERKTWNLKTLPR